MSLPQLEQNGVFTHVYPVTDLGFTPVSGSDDHITFPDDGTVAGTVFSTGMPATVLFLVKASAGSGTLNVCTGASGFTPNFGAPTATLTISGTSLLALSVDTAFVYDDSSIISTTISSDQRFVACQVVPDTGALTLLGFAVLVMYELTPGEDWFQGLRSSANAVANRTVGGGEGNVTLNPVYSHNPYLKANVLL